MVPSQDGPTPRAGARIETNYQEAAELLAFKRTKRTDKWTKSRVIREALIEYLARAEDLPEEARDLLDDDMLANAGGDKEEVADA